MTEIIAQGKSEHVVKVLRRDILEGKCPAGMPLKSIRTLASDFGVGRQVVYSALQILEKEQLIKSQPRRGYIARGRPIVSSRGIYFLAFGINEDHHYLNKLLKITYPVDLFRDYNSMTRIISKQDAAVPGMWEHELHRAEQAHGADFLIVAASTLPRPQIELALKLSKPVIFLGDFSSGCYSDLPICQVVENSSIQSPPLCLDYLQSHGCRKIAMLTFSEQDYYNRIFIERAGRAAGERGLRLNALSLPKLSIQESLDQEVINARYRQLIEKIPSDADGLLLGGVHYPWVKAVAPDLTSRIRTISTGAHLNEIPHLESDFTPFYQKVHDLCEDYMNGCNIAGRHVVDLKYRIIEP